MIILKSQEPTYLTFTENPFPPPPKKKTKIRRNLKMQNYFTSSTLGLVVLLKL